MNIVDIVRLKYQDAIENGLVTFVQHSVETGIEIKDWNIAGVARPTEQELLSEANTYRQQHLINAAKFEINNAIQKHLNDTAKQRDYDNAISIATYTDSKVIAWAAEAEIYTDWRDDVWTYAIEQLALFEGGYRELVSAEDFIKELPVMVWPE